MGVPSISAKTLTGTVGMFGARKKKRSKKQKTLLSGESIARMAKAHLLLYVNGLLDEGGWHEVKVVVSRNISFI